MTDSNSGGEHRTPQMARMPWYPRDFRSSTIGWPLEAKGIYRELLDIQWDQGVIHNDEKILRSIVGATSAQWRKAWPYVRTKFQPTGDGQLYNQRLEEHRNEAIRLVEKARSGAAKTNRKRWGHLTSINGGGNG